MWRGAGGGTPYNPAAVAITGGTASGLTITASNVPYTLAQSSIPFIHLSSGSVSAIGAITGITALPFAYGSAYCYFPANILATVNAAGWKYCTFSTTTAGTAFLDTYTSGMPTIPSSPTAVTDGKGAFTGDITERLGPSIVLPAGAMGANGSITMLTHGAVNNTAGSKRTRIRIGGIAGSLQGLMEYANVLAGVQEITTRNRGVQNRQTAGNSVTTWAGYGQSTSANNYFSDDLGVASTVDFTLIKGVATDNMVLEGFRIVVSYSS